MDYSVLYTIGHSNHTLERFLELLQLHSITAVADVRSYPRSRYCPHFDRENLRQSLEASGIRYVFLGKELGGLRTEKEQSPNGQINYEKIVTLSDFRNGCERLRKGIAKYRIAILCTEKEPTQCHRFHLVSRFLHGELEIRHILADGSMIQHEELYGELKKQMTGQPTFWENQ